MDTAELKKLISSPEDNFVERKTALPNNSELRRTVVALANSASATRKAVIYIGVRDDGTIQPVADVDSIQKTLHRVCRFDCYPPIEYTTEILDVPGGPVLAIVIPPSKVKSHFTGHAFIRRGAVIEDASEEELQELIYARSSDWAAINELVGGPMIKLEIQNIKPGESKPTQGYHTRTDGHVNVVTAQMVEVSVQPSGMRWTVPFSWVARSYDNERYKPMLIIRPK
ncbi:MAG: ATP-binding protein [Betaproteobacteria bacterium]|nr:ATP-binding protein [Betaproteobacteria bacterium]